MPLMGLVWMTCCLSGLLSYSPGLGNVSAAIKNPLSLHALSGLNPQWDKTHRLIRGGHAPVKKQRPQFKSRGVSGFNWRDKPLAQRGDRLRKQSRPESSDRQPLRDPVNWSNRLQKGQCPLEPALTNFSPGNDGGQSNFLSNRPTESPKALRISDRRTQKLDPSAQGKGPLLANFFLKDASKSEPKPTLNRLVEVKAVSGTPGPSGPMTRVNWWQSRHLFGLGQKVSWTSEAKTSQRIVFTEPSEFQVLVQGHEVAQLPDRIQADLFAHRIQEWLDQSDRDPAKLTPTTTLEGVRAIQGGDRSLLVLSEDLVKSIPRNRDLLTVEWTNNLRQALGVDPLPVAEAQAQMYGLVETGQKLQGTASWYGPYFHGRLTANGEIYDQEDMTAAHPSLPFDTYLKVKNLQNGKMVIVRINDRGPYIPPRNLDLSLGAARVLGSEDTGVISYEATFLKKTPSKTTARK